MTDEYNNYHERRRRNVRRARYCLAAYLLVAALVYGWLYHGSCKAATSGSSTFDRNACSVALAAAWPVVIPLRVAREAFDPDRTLGISIKVKP